MINNVLTSFLGEWLLQEEPSALLLRKVYKKSSCTIKYDLEKVVL